jgi:hypothetical protein
LGLKTPSTFSIILGSILHSTAKNSLSLSLGRFRRSTDHCCGSESLKNGKRQIRFPKSGEAFRQETEYRKTLISQKKFCQNKQATENLKPHNPQKLLFFCYYFPCRSKTTSKRLRLTIDLLPVTRRLE